MYVYNLHLNLVFRSAFNIEHIYVNYGNGIQINVQFKIRYMKRLKVWVDINCLKDSLAKQLEVV